MKNKILFMDLDGTLLDDRKEISQGNRQALNTALEQGVKVVITTGRPLGSAIIQAEKLGLTDEGCYLIAFNGGVIYDSYRRKVIYQETLTKDVALRVLEECSRRGIHAQTYDETGVLVEPHNDDAAIARYCDLIKTTYRVVGSMEAGLTKDPWKVLAIDYENKTPLLALESWIRENLDIDCFFSCDQYLEVVPKGLNKGASIVRMCKLLGIDVAEAVAVGDAANDLTMIAAAGTGVAMANGTEEVKSIADFVTERDNNHDGIAEVVERFFL